MKQKTLEAFEAWRADGQSVSELVQRVAEGETLKEFCKSKAIPYSLVAKYIAETPLVKAQYDAALAMWADALAQESIGIVDGATYETASVAKLRSETRLKVAAKLDRERYGEREAPRVQVDIRLGDIAKEIRELEQRLGIGAALPAVEATQALPASVSSTEVEAI